MMASARNFSADPGSLVRILEIRSSILGMFGQQSIHFLEEISMGTPQVTMISNGGPTHDAKHLLTSGRRGHG